MIDGPNLYTYVRGNPIQYYDMTGLGLRSWLVDKFGGNKGDGIDNALGNTACFSGAMVGAALATFPFALGAELASTEVILGTPALMAGDTAGTLATGASMVVGAATSWFNDLMDLGSDIAGSMFNGNAGNNPC